MSATPGSGPEANQAASVYDAAHPNIRLPVREVQECAKCGRPLVLWRRIGRPYDGVIRCGRPWRDECKDARRLVAAGGPEASPAAEARWRAARCPWPEKKQLNEWAAQMVARRMTEESREPDVRSYPCPAGHWHVGHLKYAPPVVALSGDGPGAPLLVAVKCEWCWRTVMLQGDNEAIDLGALPPVVCNTKHGRALRGWLTAKPPAAPVPTERVTYLTPTTDVDAAAERLAVALANGAPW